MYILIFPVLAATLYYGYAQNGPEVVQPVGPEFTDELDVDQKMLQFDFTSYTDMGAKRWEVKGKSASVVNEIVELEDISATTYGGGNTMAFEADEGVYDKERSKARLEKNVVITTNDGATVRSESMDWNSENNLITTDSEITIEREEITLTGKGGKVESEFRKAQLEEKVKIEMDGVGGVGGATVITCDGPLDIDYEKNTAVFNNNVKIVDEKGEVTSDKLYAYLNPETKTISKAIAKGNVRILRGDNSSTCDEAVYLPEERKVLLTGKPQIVIYPDKEFDASIFAAPGLGGEKDESRPSPDEKRRISQEGRDE